MKTFIWILAAVLAISIYKTATYIWGSAQDSSAKTNSQFKTFGYNWTNEEQNKKNDEEAARWLSDNAIAHCEFQVSASLGSYYLTFQYDPSENNQGQTAYRLKTFVFVGATPINAKTANEKINHWLRENADVKTMKWDSDAGEGMYVVVVLYKK
jgi:hypothetical protein